MVSKICPDFDSRTGHANLSKPGHESFWNLGIRYMLPTSNKHLIWFTGHSESPKSKGSPAKVGSKKEKKKDKKEKKEKDKKKAKKDKKEKKEKRKKRKSKVSSEDEEENVDVDALPEVDEDKTGNSSDEELWGFFENMDKASPDTIVQTDKFASREKCGP